MSKNSKGNPGRRRRGGCCSCGGFILRAVIAFVVMVALLFGGSLYAYNTYAKDTVGMTYGEVWSMALSLAKTKESAIVTNPYNEEEDLKAFFDTFKAGAYIKEGCEIDLQDIMNSITAEESLNGEMQNALSSIEFDTEAIRADLANAKEGDEYVPKTISVTDKQVAALINNLLSTALKMLNDMRAVENNENVEACVGEDIAYADEEEEYYDENEEKNDYYDLPEGEPLDGNGEGSGASSNPIADLARSIPFSIDPECLSVAQVIISTPNAVNKKDTMLKVTLKINMRSIADSFIDATLQSDQMSGLPVDAKYVKLAYKLVRLLIPKKTFVSMGVKPFDEEATAEIGLNAFDEAQLEKLQGAMLGLSEKGVMDFDMKETLNNINKSVVEVFKKIDEMVDLTFVDSSLSFKPIETVLKLTKMEDVTEAELVSMLKAVLIVDADQIVTDPYVEGSSDVIAKFKSKYAIEESYDLKLDDLLSAEGGSSLTNLVEHVSLKDFDLNKTNDEMKVDIEGKDLVEIVAKTLASNIGSENETLKGLDIKVAQISFEQKGENVYTMKLIASANIKQFVKDSVNGEAASGTESSESAAETESGESAAEDEIANMLKDKVTDLIDGLLPEALYLTCEITFETDSEGKVTNLNIDYDNAENIPTTLALNNLSAAETEAKLNILSKLISTVSGSGSEFTLDAFSKSIDSGVRGAIAALAENESLSIDLVFRTVNAGTENEVTSIYLPSLYELLYLVSGIDKDAELSDGNKVSAETIRLALKELVEFDAVTLGTSNYTSASGETLINAVKERYFIDDSDKLEYTGTVADGKTITDYRLTAGNLLNSEMSGDIVNRVNLNGKVFLSVDEAKVPVYGDQLAGIISEKISENMPEGISTELVKVLINKKGTVAGVTEYTIDMVLKLDIAKLGGNDGESSTNIIANLLYNDMFLTTSTSFMVEDGAIIALAYDENDVRTSMTINEATTTTDHSLSTADLMSVAQNMMSGFGGEDALAGLDLNKLSAQVDEALRNVFTTVSSSDAFGTEPSFAYKERTAGNFEACMTLPSIYDLVKSKSGADTLTSADVRAVMTKMYANVAVTTVSADVTPDLDAFVAALNTNYYLKNDKKLTVDDLFGTSGGTGELYDKLANSSDAPVDFDLLYADTSLNSARRTALNTDAFEQVLAKKIASEFANEHIQNPQIVESKLYLYSAADQTDLNATSGVDISHIGLYIYIKAEFAVEGSGANVVPQYAYIKLYTKFRDEDGYYDGSIPEKTWRTKIVIDDMTDDEQNNMFTIMNGVTGKSGSEAISIESMATSVDSIMTSVVDNLTNGSLSIDYAYNSGDKSCSLVFPSFFDYTSTILFDADYADYLAGTATSDNVFVKYPYRTTNPAETEIGEVVKSVMTKLNNYEYVNDYESDYTALKAAVDPYNYGSGANWMQQAEYYAILFNTKLSNASYSGHPTAAITDLAIKYLVKEDSSSEVSLGTDAGISDLEVTDFRLLPASVYSADKTAGLKTLWGTKYVSGNNYASMSGSVSLAVTAASGSNSELLGKLIPSTIYLHVLKNMSVDACAIRINDLSDIEQDLLFDILAKYQSNPSDEFTESKFTATLNSYLNDVLDMVEDKVAPMIGVSANAYYQDISSWTADGNSTSDTVYRENTYGYILYEAN